MVYIDLSDHAPELVMPPRQPLPKVDLRRFKKVATILDKDGFLTVLGELLAESAVNGSVHGLTAEMVAQGKSYEMPDPYVPSESALRRGRQLQLNELRRESNLPIARYAELAGKNRQNLYRDMAARRLLGIALSGTRGLRVPDWQLEPAALALTQTVLRTATDVDSWTIYWELSTPDDAFGGKAAVKAVTPTKVKSFADLICSRLGVFG